MLSCLVSPWWLLTHIESVTSMWVIFKWLNLFPTVKHEKIMQLQKNSDLTYNLNFCQKRDFRTDLITYHHPDGFPLFHFFHIFIICLQRTSSSRLWSTSAKVHARLGVLLFISNACTLEHDPLCSEPIQVLFISAYRWNICHRNSGEKKFSRQSRQLRNFTEKKTKPDPNKNVLWDYVNFTQCANWIFTPLSY